MNHRENNPAFDGVFNPFDIFLACYEVLKAVQDPQAARILADAHALLQERALKISDERQRHSFLENVPDHRKLVAAFEAMKAEGE